MMSFFFFLELLFIYLYKNIADAFMPHVCPSFTCVIGKENVYYENRVVTFALNFPFILELIGVSSLASRRKELSIYE